MLPGTVRVLKLLPAHLVAKRLPQSVLSDILALTVYNTIFFWQRLEYMLENVHLVSPSSNWGRKG